jgi:Big-like domain-containing protein
MSRIASLLQVFLLTAAVACHHKDPVAPNPPPPPPPPPPAPDVQPPSATILSPGGGSFLTGMVSIAVNAQDNVGVTKVDLLVDGVLTVTDNATPWEFSWNTDPLADGARNLVARAYDQAGNVGLSSAVPVTVRHPFRLSFRNSTYTDVLLSVQNQGTQTAPVGTVLTYTYVSKPVSVGFSGSTSGKTNQGSQVGLLMSWNDTYLSGSVQDDTVDLIVPGTYFFIKVQNCGSTINGFYVNYGLVSQTYDNISIPGDCVVRSIGYYQAYTNTQVRGYLSATISARWDQGVNFVLPFTNNQSASLRNDFSSSGIVSTLDTQMANPSRETLPRSVDLREWLSASRRAGNNQFAARAMEK